MFFQLLIVCIGLYSVRSFVALNTKSLLLSRKQSVHNPPIVASRPTRLSLFSDESWNSVMSVPSFILCDTSISEEDVLDVTGNVSNLPDPSYAIIFAGVIFLGVAILQLSLGDLTKEEGQARVRDFLKTRSETERKRGYFD